MLINRNRSKALSAQNQTPEDDRTLEDIAKQRIVPQTPQMIPVQNELMQRLGQNTNQLKLKIGPAPSESDRLRVQQERERAAALKEMDAQKAKSLQQADARAGLMGLGLAGATAPLLSDVASKADRDRTLALAELDKGNRSELEQMVDTERRRKREDEDQKDRITNRERQAKDDKFLAVQREAQIHEYEEKNGVDYNGDGFIGAPEVQNPQTDAQKKQAAKRRKEDVSDYIQTNVVDNGTYDYSWLDKNTPAGTMHEPYNLSAAERADLEELGVQFQAVPARDVWGRPMTLWRDTVTGTFFYMG